MSFNSISIPVTPIVPIVDQELPIARETVIHITQIVTKKKAEVMIFNP